MVMKKWYERPTQVGFCDVDMSEKDNIRYMGGIAYQDKIICGCCGALIDIEEIFDGVAEFFPEGTPVIIEDGYWNDVAQEIMPEV